MRISTQMMYEQNMSGITNSQAEWMKLGEQMSTGKRVTNPSDDPIAASQAVVLSQAQAQNSQYARRVRLPPKSVAGRKRTQSGDDGDSNRAGKNRLCRKRHVKRR